MLIAVSTAFAQNCNKCKNLDGFVAPDKISPIIYQMVGKMNPGDKDKSDDVKIQKNASKFMTMQTYNNVYRKTMQSQMH